MKAIVKVVLTVVALVIVAPLAIPIRVLARLDSKDQWFQFGSQTVSLFPGLPGDYIRRAYYLWVLNTRSVSIGFGTTLAQRDTEVLDGVYIGSFCNIGSSRIGRDTLIGSQVMVASPSMHYFDRLDIPIRHQGGRIEKIQIGEGAWIGNGAIVLNDVGDGALVAAGAVVTKPCERNGIYAGNPAVLIRFRGDGIAIQGNDE